MKSITIKLLYLLTAAMAVSWALGDGGWTSRLTVSEGVGALFLMSSLLLMLSRTKRKILYAGSVFPYLSLMLLLSLTSVGVNASKYIDRTWLVELCVLLYLALLSRAMAQAFDNDRDVKRVITIWLTTATLVAFVAIAQGLGLVGNSLSGLAMHDDFRPSVGFRNSAQLGIYLGTTFFVSIAFSRVAGLTKSQRLLTMTAMGSSLIGAAIASRRSVLIGTCIGLACVAWIHRKRLRAQLRLLAIVGVVAACMVLALQQNQDLRDYTAGRLEIFDAESLASDSFYSSQLQGVWNAFSSNPILGIGYARYAGSEYDSGTTLFGFGLEIHSTYLQMLAETGLLGIISYGAFMLALLRLCYLVGYKYRDPVWSEFSKTLLAGFVGLMVSWGYNRQLRDRAFWLLLALIVAIHRISVMRREERKALATFQELTKQDNSPMLVGR